MSPTAINGITILTGFVVAGEALALVLGMHVLSPSGNPWISLKNDLFLALDVIAGLGLVLVAVRSRRVVAPVTLCGLVVISVVAHGYREWEYLVGAANPFCANAPLFVLSNLKLIGLLVITGLIGLRLISRGSG